MAKRIGIDLGTTNSVIAIAEDVGDHPKFGSVTVLVDEYRRTTHASCICDCDGEVIYGEDAKYKAADGEYAPIRFWKRYMGKGITYPLRGKECKPEELSRELLVYLKGIAGKALGEDVASAVITHPAYFGADAIAATREAGDGAGLNVGENGLMMEPIAAALAYLSDTDPSEAMRVIVYDLGGGTFDVTVLERSGGMFMPLSFDGDPELGGYNFDKALATHMLEHLRSQGYTITLDPDHPERDPRWATLMHIAEEVKIYELGRPGAGGVKADVRKPRVFEDDNARPSSSASPSSATTSRP